MKTYLGFLLAASAVVACGGGDDASPPVSSSSAGGGSTTSSSGSTGGGGGGGATPHPCTTAPMLQPDQDDEFVGTLTLDDSGRAFVRAELQAARWYSAITFQGGDTVLRLRTETGELLASVDDGYPPPGGGASSLFFKTDAAGTHCLEFSSYDAWFDPDLVGQPSVSFEYTSFSVTAPSRRRASRRSSRRTTTTSPMPSRSAMAA